MKGGRTARIAGLSLWSSQAQMTNEKALSTALATTSEGMQSSRSFARRNSSKFSRLTARRRGLTVEPRHRRANGFGEGNAEIFINLKRLPPELTGSAPFSGVNGEVAQPP
jgi:hypothetical protein